MSELKLFAAIAKGNLETITELITTNCVAVDQALDTKGHRGLHIAVLKEKLAALKLLLSFKANPDVIDEQGLTPLEYVAVKADRRLNLFAEVLLEHGADPCFSCRESNYDSALDIARTNIQANPLLFYTLENYKQRKARWQRRKLLAAVKAKLQ